MEASVSSMEPSSNAGQSQAMSSGEASDEEEDNTPSSAEGESDGSDSSSDDDEANQADENGGMYSAELAELTSEISVKQQLIEELELSQRRLDIMKHHYEEKLVQLQERIRATTEERDKVLAGYVLLNDLFVFLYRSFLTLLFWYLLVLLKITVRLILMWRVRYVEFVKTMSGNCLTCSLA